LNTTFLFHYLSICEWAYVNCETSHLYVSQSKAAGLDSVCDKNLTFLCSEENFVKVNVYFKDLLVNKIEQQKSYEVSDFAIMLHKLIIE
jgi:hypothetical protein